MSGPPDRGEPRVVFSAQVEVAVPDGNPVQWFAKNLSTNGMFLQTSDPLPVGMDLGLRVLDTDGRLLFQVRGKVVWARPARSDSTIVPGMGIIFTEVSPDSRDIINQICEANPGERASWEGFFTPVTGKENRESDVIKIQIEKAAVPGRGVQRPKQVSDLILGVDLGTTYSCVSYVDRDGIPVVVPSDTNYHTLPSVITVTDNVIVGRAAVDLMAKHPRSTVHGHKRLLGRRFNAQAVQTAAKYVDYEVVADESGDAAVKIGGKIYTTAWLSAVLLKEMVAWAEDHSGERIRKAVITVPAYYTDRQRQAVMQSGRMAGLEIQQIVNEPTAAAVAYGIDRGFRKRVLVYDLGGGTFDVSIMQLNGNVFEVVTTGGDPYLGGFDFDNRIVDWLIAEFYKKTDVDLSTDPIVRMRLRQAAENAKRDLSEMATTKVNLPYVANRDSKDGVLHLDIELTREQLNQLTRDLVDRTIAICDKTLSHAKLTREDIDQVILVGGQTNAPLVQGVVRDFFGQIPRRAIHPEEAMAIGAALLGDTSRGVETIVLLDVVSTTIGVASEGQFKPLIAKDTALPAQKQFHLVTDSDGQTEVKVDVYQGGVTGESEFLGTVIVPDLRPKEAGRVRVDLHFEVDRQGFLRVAAKTSDSSVYQVVRMATADTPSQLGDVLPNPDDKKT